jgi:hypothetical protein
MTKEEKIMFVMCSVKTRAKKIEAVHFLAFANNACLFIMSTPALQTYQNELIEQAMSVGALKFGSFTLKSGRSVAFTPRFAISGY